MPLREHSCKPTERLCSPIVNHCLEQLSYSFCSSLQVDDDVIVNIDALESYLQERRHRGNLYMVRQLQMLMQSSSLDIERPR